MSDWLVKLGFGGVQTFIGQSRKVRDLAAGSRLIAELTRLAARKAPLLGADVLLPSDRTKKFEACPHQIVIRVAGDRTRADEVAKTLKTYVGDQWKERAQPTGWKEIASVERLAGAGLLRKADDLIIDQLSTAFEWYWVAVPESPTFADAFKRLQGLFDDRRHTRTFDQLKCWEMTDSNRLNAACSQCGYRVAVLQPDEARRKALTASTSTRYGPGDRLCAVCLAKREWSFRTPDLAHVPSTRVVAAQRLFRSAGFAEIREALAKAGVKDKDDVRDVLDMDDAEIIERIEAARKARDAAEVTRWQRIRRALPASGDPSLPAVSPYYALVCFDGDRMGRWFLGEGFLPGTDLAANHAALGEAMLAFAASVRAACADRCATLIYTGGDDGLLLCPLDTLLPLMDAIHDGWTTSMEPLRARASEGPPTLTLHATVAHEKAPLQPLVSALHRHLDAAKDAGRNRFSIRSEIRAGADLTLLGGWDELPTLTDAVEAWSTWRRDDCRKSEKDSEKEKEWRPDEATLAARRKAAFAQRVLHTMDEELDGFFNDRGGLVLGKELLWDMEYVMGRSGRAPDDASVPAWTVARAWLHGRASAISSPAEPCARDRLRQALRTIAFLARELQWPAKEPPAKEPALKEPALKELE